MIHSRLSVSNRAEPAPATETETEDQRNARGVGNVGVTAATRL